jgi:hypothetical protein
MGGVFSQTYFSINELWGAISFHAISMILGTACIAGLSNQKAQTAQHDPDKKTIYTPQPYCDQDAGFFV